jgi:tetratricopeptide (TPR) repeat protein
MSRRSKKKAPAVRSSPPVSQDGERLEVKNSRSLKSASPATGLNDRWLVTGVCIFLAAITFAVFGQALRHEFVNFDDDRYVYENPVVQKGLTWEGFRWALTYGQIGHWHPLTWLSHMLDCQWYGLNAGGHHLTNVLLHTATVILLFLILRRMTGFLWRSAFVAAVFAIHPLRVESVAWVAERKDVLSGLFFMLTLGAYVRYAQGRSSVERRASSAGSGSLALDPLARRSEAKMARFWTLDYGLVVLFFALGLLSKNMLVTLPFVLLLLDFWPLNRLSGFAPRVLFRRVAEKIPLLVLTVGSCVATALVPEKLTADTLPFGLRMENAVVSCVTYLWQMIHPAGLACLYPNPVNHLPLWQVAGALGLLLAISGAVWAFRQTRPWLVVGWLWYLGMMVPVIGMVQISYYAHADRYTYLPQIGLYLLLTWAAADLCAGWRHRRVVLGGGATVILVALIFCARVQTAYWRDSESLWTHTLACTSDNYIGHYNLGNVLLQKGNMNDAIAHFQTALQIKPDYVEAHNNLGGVLLKKGRVDEAIAQYQTALQIKPDNAETYYNLGNALRRKGKVDEAIAQYQMALQIKPDYAEAHINLGNALLQKGKVDEAVAQYQTALQIKPDLVEAHCDLGNALLQKGDVDEAIIHYQTALQIKPDNAEVHNNLGNILLQKGKVNEAIAQYQAALQIKPDYVEAQNNLAWVLATCPQASLRNGNKAVELAQRANQLTGDGNPGVLGTLASAYAEAGRFPEAVETAQRALHLAQTQSNTALADAIRSQLKLYQAGHPFHYTE